MTGPNGPRSLFVIVSTEYINEDSIPPGRTHQYLYTTPYRIATTRRHLSSSHPLKSHERFACHSPCVHPDSGLDHCLGCGDHHDCANSVRRDHRLQETPARPKNGRSRVFQRRCHRPPRYRGSCSHCSRLFVSVNVAILIANAWADEPTGRIRSKLHCQPRCHWRPSRMLHFQFRLTMPQRRARARLRVRLTAPKLAGPLISANTAIDRIMRSRTIRTVRRPLKDICRSWLGTS